MAPSGAARQPEEVGRIDVTYPKALGDARCHLHLSARRLHPEPPHVVDLTGGYRADLDELLDCHLRDVSRSDAQVCFPTSDKAALLRPGRYLEFRNLRDLMSTSAASVVVQLR